MLLTGGWDSRDSSNAGFTVLKFVCGGEGGGSARFRVAGCRVARRRRRLSLDFANSRLRGLLLFGWNKVLCRVFKGCYKMLQGLLGIRWLS